MSRDTWDPQRFPSPFVYRLITFCESAFQHDSTRFQKTGAGSRNPQPTSKRLAGFRLVPFRSPLLRKSNFFLFLQVLRCFTSLGSLPLPMNSETDDPDCSGTGSPIRTSPGLRLLAAYRSFSQLATSFIASPRLGIHRLPLVA